MNKKQKMMVISYMILGILISGNSCTQIGLDDPTIGIINKGIEELSQQPGRWEDSIGNLGRVIS